GLRSLPPRDPPLEGRSDPFPPPGPEAPIPPGRGSGILLAQPLPQPPPLGDFFLQLRRPPGRLLRPAGPDPLEDSFAGGQFLKPFFDQQGMFFLPEEGTEQEHSLLGCGRLPVHRLLLSPLRRDDFIQGSPFVREGLPHGRPPVLSEPPPHPHPSGVGLKNEPKGAGQLLPALIQNLRDE